MEHAAQLSILDLVLQATWVVKIILGLLIFASLSSWAMIFVKWGEISRAKKGLEHFEQSFWRSKDLETFQQTMYHDPLLEEGLGFVFRAAYREVSRTKERSTATFDAARRAMKATQMREVERLESHIAYLATVASVSPFVGLLGTVWGIMDAFTTIGAVQQATLAFVAPAIAEALVATAAGLFAAIPAAVAYNRFVHDLERIEARYEAFVEEFSNHLQRAVESKNGQFTADNDNITDGQANAGEHIKISKEETA